MKEGCLHIVNALGFLLGDVFTLLLLDKHANGIDATSTFRGVSVGSGHHQAKLRHGLLPRNGMMRHGVVKNAIHIEKHHLKRAFTTLNAKVSVAQILVYCFLYHC